MVFDKFAKGKSAGIKPFSQANQRQGGFIPAFQCNPSFVCMSQNVGDGAETNLYRTFLPNYSIIGPALCSRWPDTSTIP